MIDRLIAGYKLIRGCTDQVFFDVLKDVIFLSESISNN